MAVYKPRTPGSLKAAFACLVEACGGNEVVSKHLRCSAQRVAQMTDEDHPAAFARIDQVVVLEKSCGKRFVTEWLAAEQGCVVEPLRQGPPECMPIVLGRITADMGALLSEAARDFQAGRLTRVNAVNVLRETDDAIGATLSLRACARAVLEGGA